MRKFSDSHSVLRHVARDKFSLIPHHSCHISPPQHQLHSTFQLLGCFFLFRKNADLWSKNLPRNASLISTAKILLPCEHRSWWLNWASFDFQTGINIRLIWATERVSLRRWFLFHRHRVNSCVIKYSLLIGIHSQLLRRLRISGFVGCTDKSQCHCHLEGLRHVSALCTFSTLYGALKQLHQHHSCAFQTITKWLLLYDHTWNGWGSQAVKTIEIVTWHEGSFKHSLEKLYVQLRPPSQ